MKMNRQNAVAIALSCALLATRLALGAGVKEPEDLMGWLGLATAQDYSTAASNGEARAQFLYGLALIHTQIVKVEDRLPVISAVPLVGNLFKNTQYFIDEHATAAQVATAHHWIQCASAQHFAPAVEAEQLFRGKNEMPARVATVTGGAVKTVDAAITAKLQKLMTVEFKEAQLADVLTFLQKKSGLNIVLLSDWSNTSTITLSVRDLPLEQIFRYLGAIANLDYALENGAAVFRGKGGDKSDAKSVAKGADAALLAKLNKPIDVEFVDAPLGQVLDFLRGLTKVNYLQLGQNHPRITLTVKEMPLGQMVRYLGEIIGEECTTEGAAVVFRDRPPQPAQAGVGADSYKMETSVESAQEPHQYTVAIKILQSPDGKKWDVLSSPRVTTRAGQEAKIEVKDEKTGDGIECTVLVNEVAAGTVEMSVVCKVKEPGKPQWQSELKTRIKLP